MAATTTDRAFRRKLVPTATRMDELELAASTTLYAGTIAIIDSNGRLAAPSGSDGSAVIVVFCDENTDNGSGSAGDLSYSPEYGCVVELVSSGLTAADVGKIAYASDNQTFTLTAGTNAIIGKVFKYISATRALVMVQGLL